jgi:DNA-binding transcriptional MocR family regulator
MTKEQRSFAEKWSSKILEPGYTQIPNLLIMYQKDLGITTTQFVVIVHCLRFKWGEADPFPSAVTIAAEIGLSPSTVRTAYRVLEEQGLLRRNFRTGSTTRYDWGPLARRLEALAHAHPPRKQRSPASAPAERPPWSLVDTKEDSVKKDPIKKHSQSTNDFSSSKGDYRGKSSEEAEAEFEEASRKYLERQPRRGEV